MSYPTFNLESNYQDINSDNADIVGRYVTLLWNAINKTTDEILQKVPTFNDVSQYYTANETTLEPVIFNAETVNSIIDYLKDLKNYTINSKNQLFFISEGELNSEYFNTLNATLVEGDVIVITSNEPRRTIKSFKQKQSDGSYQIVGTILSNNNYMECTQVISGTAYVTSDNPEILHGEGSEFFIRFMTYSQVSHKNKLYLNINGTVFDDIVFRGNSVLWGDISTYNKSTYHFVLNYVTGADGNTHARLEMISYIDKEINTGWIDCEYATFTQAITNHCIPRFVPYSRASSNRAKVRRIGNQVYLRGKLTNTAGINSNTYEEAFIIPSNCRPSYPIVLTAQGSSGHIFTLKISTGGNVEIGNFSGTEVTAGGSNYTSDYVNVETTPPETYWSSNGEEFNCFGSWLIN